MSFDWKEYFLLANRLGAETDEASKRSAISRAYYFAYHLARSRAEKNNCVFSKNRPSHSQCWETYQASPDRSCAQVGVIGDRLKRKRHKADYAPLLLGIDYEVRTALSWTRDIESSIASLDPKYPTP